MTIAPTHQTPHKETLTVIPKVMPVTRMMITMELPTIHLIIALEMENSIGHRPKILTILRIHQIGTEMVARIRVKMMTWTMMALTTTSTYVNDQVIHHPAQLGSQMPSRTSTEMDVEILTKTQMMMGMDLMMLKMIALQPLEPQHSEKLGVLTPMAMNGPIRSMIVHCKLATQPLEVRMHVLTPMEMDGLMMMTPSTWTLHNGPILMEMGTETTQKVRILMNAPLK